MALSACSTDPYAGVADPAQPAPDAAALRLEAVSAPIQGTVASPVDPVPTVVVKTPAGAPVAGIGVSFTLAGGAEFSGSVVNARAVTNAQGIATPGQWILGAKATAQGLIATLLAAGPTRSIAFRVEAAPAAPAQLSAWSAGWQVAIPGWQINAPAIQVTDRFGNRVHRSGLPVSFVVIDGGGQLAKSEVYTDSRGYASAESWTLGPSVGLNSVVASAANVDSARFTAEALDARKLTWYDLDSVDNRSSAISTGSIGLSDMGYFVAETFYGALDRRWLGGTYRVFGTEFFFGKYAGTDGYIIESNKNYFVNDRLSIVWCPPWYDCFFSAPPAEEVRKYGKRKGQ